MAGARILLADDESGIREAYSRLLTRAGHLVDTAADGEEVLAKVRSVPYDLLLTDMVFPPSDGITVLKQVKQIRPTMLVVLFSGHAAVENVLTAFRGGAYDFLEKPVDVERLEELATRALSVREMGEKRRRMAEDLENERLRVMQLKQQLGLDDPFRNIVGNSPIIQGFIDTLREVARTDSTVLLTGESGTGKGLVARTIHEASARNAGPFVEANCVVYSEGILHSELFGHERGAFTGAARTKKGRFELAAEGTLFLDEIGEIPAATQLLLLRVLQDRTFERVGGEETLEANVRLIAATNRDLQEAIQQGEFRSDLYYRLNVIPVHMPALREHPEDIPVMAQHFLASYAARLGREIEGFSEEALGALVRYNWPGNVRELQNVIERIVVLNRGSLVQMPDLPANLREALTEMVFRDMPGTLQDVERVRIADALRESNGNKKLAASRLGIHRSTLYAKIRRYRLDHLNGGVESDRREAGHSAPEIATPVSNSSR
jgi:two-component system response regulator HydG